MKSKIYLLSYINGTYEDRCKSVIKGFESLQGIENNNGWKILKEDSNLEEGRYHVFCNGRVDVMIYFQGYFYDYDQKYKALSEVTHYDEYIERKPPIWKL